MRCVVRHLHAAVRYCWGDLDNPATMRPRAPARRETVMHAWHSAAMNTAIDDPNEEITVEAAAAILGRKPRAVHGYAAAGRLQIKRVGRRHLFDRAEIEALAAELGTVDALAERTATPLAPTMPDALMPMIRSLHAEINDLRLRLSTLANTNHGTRMIVEEIEADLARRASWPTELDLRVALTVATAERDMLRAALNARHRWWDIASAVLIIAGALMALLVVLTSLRIIPTG